MEPTMITAAETLAVRTAEAAFNADEMDVAALRALEDAEKVHLAAIRAARAEWAAIAEGDAKDAAAENANDTIAEYGEHDDLTWLRCAIGSVEV